MATTLARVQKRYASVRALLQEPPDAAEVPDGKDVLKRGSMAEQQAFYMASKLRHRKGFFVRAALARELQLECAIGRKLNRAPYTEIKLPNMVGDLGMSIVRGASFPTLTAALEEARESFRQYQPGTTKREKDSLEGVTRLSKSYDSAINRLATHPELLRVASRYLGILPVLYRINLLYSPNDDIYAKSSQFWHLDPGDIAQAKVFIWVEDVDENTGPLSAIPAWKSAKIRKKLNYRLERVTDETLEELGATQQITEFTGPAGTMIFVDTNRCFHMGSRPGTKPRYAIMLQYVTPYHAMFPLDGELPVPMIGRSGIPPKPSFRDQYLFGRKR